MDLRAFVAGAALFGGLGCRPVAPETDAERWLDLVIERPGSARSSLGSPPEPGIEQKGMITELFQVPPGFLVENPAPRGPVDPPAPPGGEDVSPHRRTAEEMLERFGARFGDNAFARLDPATSTIIVRQTPEEMDLVEAIIGAGRRFSIRSIALRVEIYQVTEPAAIAIARAAVPLRDHAPERDAVLALLRRGEASLVQTASAICPSGQSCLFVDGRAMALDSAPAIVEADGTAMSEAGNFLEVKPLIGRYGKSIDVILTLEFHDGDPAGPEPPLLQEAAERIPAEPIKVPSSPRKAIRFQETMADSEIRLIGIRTPGQKGQRGEPGMRHLVFLEAAIQSADVDPWP